MVPYSPEMLAAGRLLQEEPLVDEEVEKMEFYTILFLIMVFFFVMAAVNEKFKPKCGHQTSYTIILGVLVSFVLWAGFGYKRTEIYRFN